MKEIDFRPDWYCVIRKRKRDAVIRASLLGVLAIELGVGFLAVSTRNAEAQQQLSDLRSALENQATAFESFGELVIDLSELRTKRALLSDVAGGAPVHAILAELSGLMPESLAITAMSYKQHRRIGGRVAVEGSTPAKSGTMQMENDNGLEIKGLAASDGDIGAFMSRMAASSLFTNIALTYSQPIIRGGFPARDFELTCVVPQFE